MNPKKPNTASVRMREDTYAKIAANGVKFGVKGIDVIEAMAMLWFEQPEIDQAVRLGARTMPQHVEQLDAYGRRMGKAASSI